MGEQWNSGGLSGKFQVMGPCTHLGTRQNQVLWQWNCLRKNDETLLEQLLLFFLSWIKFFWQRKQLEFGEISCSESLKLYWNTDNKPPFISLNWNAFYTQSKPSSDSVPAASPHSWRENGDMQFSALPSGENVPTTAVTFRTEALLLREQGHSYVEQVLLKCWFLQQALSRFSKEKERCE